MPFFPRKYFPDFFYYEKKTTTEFSAIVDLDIISTDSIRLNFEFLKLLRLCMDLHKICFKL